MFSCEQAFDEEAVAQAESGEAQDSGARSGCGHVDQCRISPDCAGCVILCRDEAGPIRLDRIAYSNRGGFVRQFYVLYFVARHCAMWSASYIPPSHDRRGWGPCPLRGLDGFPWSGKWSSCWEVRPGVWVPLVLRSGSGLP